jgi:hypothetical protein
MTDAAVSANDAQPAAEPAVPPTSPIAAAAPASAADEHPELVIGAAFAGGLALALLLKRLGR